MPSFINFNNKQELTSNVYTKKQISEALYVTESKDSRKIEALVEGLDRTTPLNEALNLFKNKLDGMSALSVAKNHYSGTLYEGQFSWMTQDSGQQIGSEKQNTIDVWMYDNKGNSWYEKRYDGYGEFGGMDYYELLARMNGYTEEDLEDKAVLKSIRVMGKGSMRDIGIALAFGEGKLKTRDKGGDVLFPALVADGRYNWKRHNFKQEAEGDPNQSWYQEEEYDDYEDDYDEEYYESASMSVNEWGSSDQSIFLDAMHKDAGKPKKMPSPFDSKLRAAAEDAVDFYWEDWPEYKSDREGLVDDAVRSYLRRYFKKDFEMMQRMFEPMESLKIEEGKSFDELYESALLENAVRDLHFETDPKKAEELKIEIGASQGEVTRKKQIEGGEYSLRRFRKEIKYDTTGEDLGVFKPGSYMASTSTLGDGPHKKAVKKVKWNLKKYNQWLEDVASNGGWENAYDMAQNAKHEPGLLDWAKKEFRGEDVMQRIQWDIEAFAESVVTEKYNKKSLMKAMKKDDGLILVNGNEYIIYKYGNGNDDNDAMWNDDSIFALDQDGEEHEIKYADIERYSESLVTEAKGFKNDEDFEEFLKEIDAMPEGKIRKIMGKDYIDTPGFYQDEKDNYEDVIDFMTSNMGTKEFEKLQDWWENNVAESTDTKKLTWDSLKEALGINEAKKMSIGDQGVDYNDNIVEIIAIGNFKKVAKMFKKEMKADAADWGYEEGAGDFYLTKNIEATEGNVGDLAIYPVKYDMANYWGLDPLKESKVNEGRSINKISKEHSAVVLDMANTVKEWKEAEGDRKSDLLEKLRGLNKRKADLEKELDQAVAGKDSEVELALSENRSIMAIDSYLNTKDEEVLIDFLDDAYGNSDDRKTRKEWEDARKDLSYSELVDFAVAHAENFGMDLQDIKDAIEVYESAVNEKDDAGTHLD
ncbi:MAG: hypothetical protein HKN86_02760, partial [Acidimicrobiia bacterium]|nr:hypothetical protein [Acidimicrobiia bacterium]